MLNRYGLFEADEHLRQLERRAHSTGAEDDHEAFTHAVKRSGDHNWHSRYMNNAVKGWQDADEAHQNAASMSHPSKGPVERQKTADARRVASSKVFATARKIGRHGSEFFDPKPGEAHRDHALRLGTLAGGNRFGTGRYIGGKHRFAFESPSSADHFHAALGHHYPHWKSKRKQVAGLSGYRHEVHFHPGDSWDKPHDQPTSRK